MLLRTLCQNFRQLTIAHQQACLISHVANGFKTTTTSRIIVGGISQCCEGANHACSRGRFADAAVRHVHTTAAVEKSRFIPFGKTGKQKYTVRPLPMVRYSGRDPDTGTFSKTFLYFSSFFCYFLRLFPQFFLHFVSLVLHMGASPPGKAFLGYANE